MDDDLDEGGLDKDLDEASDLAQAAAPHSETGKPVTSAYLERAAVFYLDRYASSAANLRRVLLRKARRRSGRPADDETERLVRETVEKAIRSGLLDDRSYADTKLGSLLRRGTSMARARSTLAAKGVTPETIETALAEAETDEFAQARRFAERRRLGPFRRSPDPSPDPARRERDLAALGRAGFSYRAACAALEDPPGRPD